MVGSSDGFPQRRRHLEPDRFAGFYFHGLAGPGVEGLTRFCLDDAERAKAGKGEAAGAFQLLDDRRDDISGGAVCGHCRRPGGFLQNGGQKGFGHDRESLLVML
jgi:hypothetical protein